MMTLSKIIFLRAYELFDSRGNPTVGVRIKTEKGADLMSIVPSGASTGKFEAAELRDVSLRLGGKGVRRAVENVNSLIAPSIVGREVDLSFADKTMLDLDGSENKSRLGANAILGVSMAVCKAEAADKGIPLYRHIADLSGQTPTLPVPMMNILNGGAHAANNIDIQEFMIRPQKPSSFSEGMDICVDVYRALGSLLKKAGKQSGVGDEGGFAPDLSCEEEALDLICEAIVKAGYNDNRVKICLDAAASEWYCQNGIYRRPKRDIKLDRDELIGFYLELAEKYPIVSIEDPLSEEDMEGTAKITSLAEGRLQIVGDDLFVTNKKRLKMGADKGAANAILIKPNQIGTVSETLEVMSFARQSGYAAVVSHRSGDTEDTFIADLAVGTAAGQIKTGAPARSERVAKYNRLLIIEDELA